MQMTVLSRFRSVKCHFVITSFVNGVLEYCEYILRGTFAMAASLISRIAVAIMRIHLLCNRSSH